MRTAPVNLEAATDPMIADAPPIAALPVAQTDPKVPAQEMAARLRAKFINTVNPSF